MENLREDNRFPAEVCVRNLRNMERQCYPLDRDVLLEPSYDLDTGALNLGSTR
jgi:hypothetical protein